MRVLNTSFPHFNSAIGRYVYGKTVYFFHKSLTRKSIAPTGLVKSTNLRVLVHATCFLPKNLKHRGLYSAPQVYRQSFYSSSRRTRERVSNLQCAIPLICPVHRACAAASAFCFSLLLLSAAPGCCFCPLFQPAAFVCCSSLPL